MIIAVSKGNSVDKGAIFYFTPLGPAHAHDISTVLDKKRGVAIRAGKHCAAPLMAHLSVTAIYRALFRLHHTEAEVDAPIDAVDLCHELFA